MTVCLTFGTLKLTGEQVVAALIRHQLLESLLEQILLDSILTSVSISEGEVFEHLTGRDRAIAPDDFQVFLRDWASQRQLTQADLEKAVRQLRIQKLKQTQFDRQINAEFLQRKSEFDQVVLSLIRTSNHQLAEELLFQLRDDQVSFESLATQYSEGTERDSQGWIGLVRLSNLPMPVAQIVYQGQVGQIYGPIVLEDQAWIIRIEQFFAARLTEWVRVDLRNQRFNRWLRSTLHSSIAEPGQLQLNANQTPAEAIV
ncbi:hypothetical protein NIES2135_67510 (plasmid) [Leptolyngbya boryana NIES-2135]|jgi:parvulin-like peptidyl-prolyl isomerase|uniref:peptidylprolyl isomerase n=1 Tax=Leptolyngbya boryana NIES-2135 TaxID=1973484 RepID=A0A1Z4JT18_LEPBY|nr:MULTISPECIES: peptidylprolyl isomerase [Leptolyngbya]BAY59874.1 hypothetical protein NIES2135_67510 [Leptolyngbya boryana NIES-2135]MBD2369574.1 peptidylprolyl isomerase [Leptolyngbya sp. FACHB-161]MBD2375981.1 peptidylprolyl isomerase [Leptolyngbya sp. FACHB-238]MBD2400257.1 peptidylprolyl isomerase [Leptolyngbya sp. FACHB-239]MBD2406799.1 peptidylprolyl isomerase [Leptolyngbya sp. FACHB-402]